MTRRRAKGAGRAMGGLSQALAERAIGRFGRSARGRIATTGALRALTVLLRRHPGAAVDMAGAGIVAAGRAGLKEARTWLGSEPAPVPKGRREKPVARKSRIPKRLNSRDRRRLRKAMAKDAAQVGPEKTPRG